VRAISRRRFIHAAGAGTLALAGGEVLPGGRVLGFWSRSLPAEFQADRTTLLLHNNENPLGPSPQALEAIAAKLTEPGVPAARYTSLAPKLAEAVAAREKCKPENVLVGCGSTQILRTATFAYTSPSRPLVAGVPTYEECSDVATLVGAPIRGVPATRTGHHDLEAMAAAARGAGLIFLDNPSNPAATVHAALDVRSFIARVRRESPDTTILLDEAYHDYVTDERHASQIPLALEDPRVIVARTFSKAYGMAGLRVGYAVGSAETIADLRALQYSQGTNVLGVAAALASLEDPERIERERARNARVRQTTLDWFARHGYEATASQANFVFVNVRQSCADFRAACARHHVLVGRDFPPYQHSHVRISLGTESEMERALSVFGRVLGS
jgi:histidinol-phosphate aminotransferase